jgi:hypothetical protein
VYTTEKNETEAPIYNQILDLEAIEVHKLICEIENQGGTCLSVRTDCVECIFPDDKLPFYHDEKDNNNLIGFKHENKDGIYTVTQMTENFFWDEVNFEQPKYKLEEKCEGKTNIIEKLPKYVRTGKYEHILQSIILFQMLRIIILILWLNLFYYLINQFILTDVLDVGNQH